MIKGIIFDMDGVLVDSQPMHFKADIDTMASYQVNVTMKDLEKYAGTSNENRWSALKKEYHMQESVSTLISTQTSIIRKLLAEWELAPIEGIVALLDHLQSMDYSLAVASSSSYEFIHHMLLKLKLTDYFQFVVSGEDMIHGKPEPDIFLHTAHKMALEATECLVIEDSANGVQAASRAGMKCIAYVNKSSGQQDLSAATKVVDNFNIIRHPLIDQL